MTKSDLWKLGVADIIAATRSGERSATDIVEAAIDRMDQVNPALNAVVMDLSDQARQRAADLDRARESGADLGPLHGVPVTIKVNVDQAGWATTNGVKALENLVAVSDAPVVRNLLNAGAVVIEHGGGSGAAYPIARDVMTFMFDPQKGLDALTALEKEWGGTAQERLQRRYAEYARAAGEAVPASPPADREIQARVDAEARLEAQRSEAFARKNPRRVRRPEEPDQPASGDNQQAPAGDAE